MPRTPIGMLVVPIALLCLAAVPAAAGVLRLGALVAGRTSPVDVRFLEAPAPVILHLLAVVPYSVLGALQVAPMFHGRRWHRAAGRLLVPLGLVGALTGLWMAEFYPWPAGDGEGVYLLRLLAGTLMTAALVLGVVSLRRRDYGAHGAWMIRAYALGMGAGTQVITHLPWFVFVGQPGEIARAWLMGLAWAINVAMAEHVIHRRSARERATAGQGSRPSAIASREFSHS